MPHGFCRVKVTRPQNLTPSMLNPKLEAESQTPVLEAAGTLHYFTFHRHDITTLCSGDQGFSALEVSVASMQQDGRMENCSSYMSMIQ